MDDYRESLREQNERMLARAQRDYEDPKHDEECDEDCASCDFKDGECDASTWVDPESLCSECKQALEDCECEGKIAEKGEDENA